MRRTCHRLQSLGGGGHPLLHGLTVLVVEEHLVVGPGHHQTMSGRTAEGATRLPFLLWSGYKTQRKNNKS